MFCTFVALSLIQICILTIRYLNPSFFIEKGHKMLQMAAYISLLLVFSTGGLQEYIGGTGPYGSPANWAQAVFWSLTSIVIAVQPPRK